MSPRLSRKERQAHTRDCLMQSAARVFKRRGLEGASIDEVASDAGFTKGAFYANFKSKEELFLAMLDQRFAERVDEIEKLLGSDQTLPEQARAGGQEFHEQVVRDPEWERLFFEFAAYAARDDGFRQELVARYRTLVDRMAEGLQRRADEVGFTPPGPVEAFALMICAAGNGAALHELLDPDGVPENFFAGMMELLTLGAIAKAGQLQDQT